MIAKKKITKNDKKLIAAVSLFLVIALLFGAYFIVRAIADNDSGGENDDFNLELLEGESYYAGIPIAYPMIESSKMKNIIINKQK